MRYLYDNQGFIQSKYNGQKIPKGWSVFDDVNNQIKKTHSDRLPVWKVQNGELISVTSSDFKPHPEYEMSLSELKSRIISDIDSKTESIISAGFSHNSTKFSMSQNAQINWLGLETLIPSLTYPYKISTKFDGVYELQDQNEAVTFCSAAKSHKETAITSGREQKTIVNAMQTIEQLKSYVDPR